MRSQEGLTAALVIVGVFGCLSRPACADGITIDLAGRTLSFTGVLPPIGPISNDPHGVSNVGGFDGVTIKGGTIIGFNVGVSAIGADALVVEDLIVRANTVGMALRDVDGSRIANDD